MTAAAAIYTPTGIVIGADSRTTCLGAHIEVRKIWAHGDWRMAGAGDGDVLRLVQAGDLDTSGDPTRMLYSYLLAIREQAASIGMVRDGVGGTRWVSADIIAAHPVHGLWLLSDGQGVLRWTPEMGMLAIGDPSAVRAAYVALGGVPTLECVADALRVVGQVSAVVGGPYHLEGWSGREWVGVVR